MARSASLSPSPTRPSQSRMAPRKDQRSPRLAHLNVIPCPWGRLGPWSDTRSCEAVGRGGTLSPRRILMMMCWCIGADGVGSASGLDGSSNGGGAIGVDSTLRPRPIGLVAAIIVGALDYGSIE